LAEEEVEAIEQGYDLREKVHRKLAEVPLTPPDEQARKGLELLAWMIAQNRLDLKVAVPVGPSGKPVKGLGLYHEKVGVITDTGGSLISFSGSINETAGGWVNNRENFHVYCSWLGGRELQHVQDEVEAFVKLWEDRATSTRVFDFPEAVKQKLLAFCQQVTNSLRRPIRPSNRLNKLQPISSGRMRCDAWFGRTFATPPSYGTGFGWAKPPQLWNPGRTNFELSGYSSKVGRAGTC